MKPSRMAGLVLLALTAACSRATEPFTLPDIKNVDYVNATQFKDGTKRVWEQEIRDPKRIEPILAHFREHNSGYRTASRLRELFSERSDQDYALAFSGYDGVSLIIWIGPDWIGGFDTVERQNGPDRYRPLSASEREALLGLIREPDPMGRVIISDGQYR